MKINEVLKNFFLISGVDEEESSVYMPIVKEAVKSIILKLKDTNIKDKDKPRLNYAAAVLAFYRYMILKRAKTITGDFSAGDLSVKSDLDASLKAIEDIWFSTKEEIVDLLRDDNFCFRSIPVFDNYL